MPPPAAPGPADERPDERGTQIEPIIHDELTAVGQYLALARDTDDDVLRGILMSIASDEYGHARVFETLKRFLCLGPAPTLASGSGVAGVRTPLQGR